MLSLVLCCDSGLLRHCLYCTHGTHTHTHTHTKHTNIKAHNTHVRVYTHAHLQAVDGRISSKYRTPEGFFDAATCLKVSLQGGLANIIYVDLTPTFRSRCLFLCNHYHMTAVMISSLHLTLNRRFAIMLGLFFRDSQINCVPIQREECLSRLLYLLLFLFGWCFAQVSVEAFKGHGNRRMMMMMMMMIMIMMMMMMMMRRRRRRRKLFLLILLACN